ncbi:hypothetical protein diail_11126, partial [Diaporthe ilicicola]
LLAHLQNSNYTCPASQYTAASECASPGSAASVQLQDPCEPQPTDNCIQQSLAEQQRCTSPGITPSVQMQNPGEPQPTDNPTRWSNAEQQLPPITTAHPNNSSLPPLADTASPGMRLAPLMDSIHRGRGLPPLLGHSQDMAELPLVRRVTETYADGHLRAFPRARNISSLLPYQFCTSVVKSDLLAAIRVIFGRTPSQCYIQIDIYASRVPNIARELFGAILEVEEGRLWMRLASGSSTTFESMTLSGADRKGAENLLGVFFELITADSLYTEELDLGESRTRLISMDIKGNVEDSSCLKVRSTAHTASVIARQLWPTFPFPPRGEIDI